ncbi:hydrolase [Clostridium massiliamazoniense]|uniref:hydrolase n=1 Tax=Clostridium massiliamazoniense TaxID=1347366 RepID=UPI000A619AE4|nr:hydrolase [Clostridium massiliamazoniense]
MEIVYPNEFLNFIGNDESYREDEYLRSKKKISRRAYRECLLDPCDVTMLIIDEQPQMFFGIESNSRLNVMNNIVGLVKAAKIFNIPVILTTVAEKEFSGPIYSKIQKLCPRQVPINRSTLNAWEDERVRRAVCETGRKKLIIAGLWTEVCVTLPTLSAICDGYEVYVVTDASAGSSKEAHEMAINRMMQCKAKMVTWQAVLLEFQRDWNNKETYDAVTKVIREHGGAYGLGIEYVKEMFSKCRE